MFPGNLKVVDYSVVARDCTFIGIKLPTVGLREKCDYLRGSDFVFERCRFVRCHVPQSFLAATKDSVFEDCTFSTVGEIWPRTSVDQHVEALWAGEKNEPRSYEKGPFSVVFREASADVQAGSSLEFEEASGVVTLPQFAAPTNFTQIGTFASRNASDM